MVNAVVDIRPESSFPVEDRGRQRMAARVSDPYPSHAGPAGATFILVLLLGRPFGALEKGLGGSLLPSPCGGRSPRFTWPIPGHSRKDGMT